MIITQTLLRERINYDEASGLLTWLEAKPHHFENGRTLTKFQKANRFNSLHKGNLAFNTLTSNGYFRGSIYGKNLMSHRVAWMIIHGEWPAFIDHINHVGIDNRLENLREVSKLENSKNQRKGRNNSSVIIGVSFVTSRMKWQASIMNAGKNCFLGYFDTIEEAAEVRKRYEEILNYHENHGKN